MGNKSDHLPKPMVEVGGRPLLWHIMRSYAAYGVRDFILCLGYRGDVIRDYFINFPYRGGADLRVDLADGHIDVLTKHNTDWRVTLVETGANALTGARIRRAIKYVTERRFFATYGDGLSNIDVSALLKFHLDQKRRATVSAVLAPSRFGELSLDGHLVTSLAEKPQISSRWINGGFLVIETEAMLEFSDDDELALEGGVLKSFAARRELAVFKHSGFWQCVDNVRELDLLKNMWHRGNVPWLRAKSRSEKLGLRSEELAWSSVEA